jgi:tRNA threonylcarbamoyladenosine biosynthesis protein TsaE
MNISYTINELPLIIKKHIFPLLQTYSIITISGPLGAGKTTLIKGILAECGVTEMVTSPTFAYLNIYYNKIGDRFHHFDLYRLDSLDEFLAAGFDEYLFMPKSWNFVEWPEILEPILTSSEVKSSVCSIQLTLVRDDIQARILSIE